MPIQEGELTPHQREEFLSGCSTELISGYKSFRSILEIIADGRGRVMPVLRGQRNYQSLSYIIVPRDDGINRGRLQKLLEASLNGYAGVRDSHSGGGWSHYIDWL